MYAANFIALMVLIVLVMPSISRSMEFELISESAFEVDGHKFPARRSILARGKIVNGDAADFAYALSQAGRDQYGNITVYLNSDGGSVSEAMAMVEFMDFYEVTAIVRKGDLCASSCASILFASARIHFVEEGGFLGFHSCTVGGGYPSSICNEGISDNARFHGTAHDSVMAFMENTAKSNFKQEDRSQHSNQMYYFGKAEAIRSGLYGPPIYDPTLAIPSFDCHTASGNTRKLICKSPQIARYEASSDRIYNLLMEIERNSEVRKGAKLLRKTVEKKINACSDDYVCVLNKYAAWRAVIREIYVRRKLLSMIGQYEGEMTESQIRGLKLISKVLDYCRNEKECGRPVILDRPYEMMNENSTMHIIKEVLNGVSDYTDDCALPGLCSMDIHTMDFVNIQKPKDEK